MRGSGVGGGIIIVNDRNNAMAIRHGNSNRTSNGALLGKQNQEKTKTPTRDPTTSPVARHSGSAQN